MDTLATIRSVLGDSALTNIMLAVGVVELRRAAPYWRAIVAHFNLTPIPFKRRASTEPGV